MKPNVLQLMQHPPIVVSEDAPLREAIHKMQTFGVSHLPVLGERGAVVGVISDRDLLRPGLHKTSLLTPKCRKMLGKSVTVSRVMSTEVETVPESMPIWEATKQMLSRKIHSVVVVSHGELKGIVTSTDILRWCVDNQPDDTGWTVDPFRD